MTFHVTTMGRALIGLGALAACSGEASSEAPPAPTGGVEAQLEAARQQLLPREADVAAQPSYFELRRDVRRCAAPFCGGFFVQRVNRLGTLCADGTRGAECYVMALDFSALGLAGEQIDRIEAAPEDVLLRGSLGSEDTASGALGVLNVTEAWSGHAGVEPTGAFLRVRNEGVVCITSPCPSFSAELLDGPRVNVPIAEVELSGIGDDPRDAFTQLNEPDGLIVAGQPAIVRGPGGRALGVDASEYYVPVTAAAPALCGTRGVPPCEDGNYCDFPPESECGRADRPGVCAPLPEACIEIFAPVCGCDGQTYDNSCFANAAGVSAEAQRPCEPGEAEAR